MSKNNAVSESQLTKRRNVIIKGVGQIGKTMKF